ncbi:unnamed protein product [Arabidopsis halleri]
MKFITLVFIAFVLSSLAPTKAVVVKVEGEEEKVACIVTDLRVCLPAVQAGSQPSMQCCGKLKEQYSCLCGYLKIPSFSQYVSSGKAQKVLTACGIPIPKC